MLYGTCRDWPRPDDPLLSAWLAVNCIREWRGDTHWAILIAEDIGQVESGILHGAWMNYADDWLPRSRGADYAALEAAFAELERRGLATNGAVNARGIEYRQELEDRLDGLACGRVEGARRGTHAAVPRPGRARRGPPRRTHRPHRRTPTGCRPPGTGRHDDQRRRCGSIAARPHDVWAVLADFGAISSWAPNVDHSCLLTDQAAGSAPPVASRPAARRSSRRWQCGLLPPSTGRVCCRIRSPDCPGSIRSVTNTWHLSLRGDATIVTLTSTVDAGPRPPQKGIARIVSRKLASASDEMIAGLTAGHIATTEKNA